MYSLPADICKSDLMKDLLVQLMPSAFLHGDSTGFCYEHVTEILMLCLAATFYILFDFCVVAYTTVLDILLHSIIWEWGIFNLVYPYYTGILAPK